LVYGGSGWLGRGMLKQFSEKGWQTYSVDITDVPKDYKKYVTSSCVVDKNGSSTEQLKKASESVEEYLKSQKNKRIRLCNSYRRRICNG